MTALNLFLQVSHTKCKNMVDMLVCMAVLNFPKAQLRS